MTPSITQAQINKALGNLLQAMIPGLKAIVGQVNRVAEPSGDFAVMWPLRRPRLATNVDTAIDTKFTGSIAATVMTVSAVAAGAILAGRSFFGVGVAANSKVVSQQTGPAGGAGTYTISPPQTLSSRTLSAGSSNVEQSTEIVMQVDVHGPNSADNAQTISTLFRDDYAVQQLATAAIAIAPLYADDPKQMPFTTAAIQFEERWMVDLHLQVNPVVTIPQQFAGALSLDIIDVETPAASWPNSVVTAP
jgi:hypothetical protein